MDDARAAGSRLVATLALVLVAALLAAGGTAMLFAALYLWLSTQMPPWAAALLTALAVFVAAFLLLAIGRRSTAPRRVRASGPGVAAPAGTVPPNAGSAGLAAAVGNEIGTVSAGWLRGHAPQIVAAAAAAGFLVGVSPRLRRALWRILD